jgi:predicted DNA-binding transcriptional regulator AlpA
MRKAVENKTTLKREERDMRMEIEELIKFEEVAWITGIKIATLRRWATEGKIPCRKINGAVRFSPSEIKQWLDNCARGDVSGGVIAKGNRKAAEAAVIQGELV